MIDEIENLRAALTKAEAENKKLALEVMSLHGQACDEADRIRAEARRGGRVMRSADWQPMETAPLNPYGKAYGPVVLIWCRSDNNPWPAYYSPWHGWESRDCGPAWVIPDQEPPIQPEDAVAWMPIAAPWSEVDVKKSLTTSDLQAAEEGER